MSNYMVYTTRNRETGTTIELYDRKHPHHVKGRLGDEGKRWTIVCTEHKSLSHHDKQSIAYTAMTKPSHWCEGCQRLKEGGEITGKAKKVSSRVVQPAPYQGRPEEPLQKHLEDYTQKELDQYNICSNLCGNPLRAADGHFHSKGRPAYNVCCKCVGCPGVLEVRR